MSDDDNVNIGMYVEDCWILYRCVHLRLTYRRWGHQYPQYGIFWITILGFYFIAQFKLVTL